MHETVLASSILKTALEALQNFDSQGRKLRIERIDLTVGLLTQVEARTLQNCFELLAEGTAAENAQLRIKILPMTRVCRACGVRAETASREFSCPGCNASSVDWQGGSELEISSISVISEGNEDQQHES